MFERTPHQTLVALATAATLSACFASGPRPVVQVRAAPRVCAGGAPRIMWPLRGDPSRDWAVIAYLDQDPSPGKRDFMGYTGVDAITYDGHDGIDIGLAGFDVMDRGVPVFAGLEGVVKRSEDGAPDRNTADTPAEIKRQANYVLVETPNGYTVAYWHLRKGSVQVRPGDPVHVAQQIGEVGSSGLSSGPHLHLSAYDCNGVAIDLNAAGLLDDAPPYDPPPGLMDFRVTRQDGARLELYLLLASIRKGDRVSLTATPVGGAPFTLAVSNDTARQIPNFYWTPTLDLSAAATWTLTTRVNDTVVDERAWPWAVLTP